MSEILKSKESSYVVAGLDVGTTKISYLIGLVHSDKSVEIVGVGSSLNSGIRDGVVVNLEVVQEAIQKAREEAEMVSGLKTSSVWFSYGGSHIESFDSSGMIALYNKEITAEDTRRVIEMAKAVWIPTDRKILHVLPKDYIVDRQSGISDPRGMSGVRLEVSVHIVTASMHTLKTYYKCIEKLGLKVKGAVLRQYASALSVLEEDEKSMGVSLIDIGGDFCDLITFVSGKVVDIKSIPLGGAHFTRDIMNVLKTNYNVSESLKKKYACALSDLVSEDEVIKLEESTRENESQIRRKKNITRKNLSQVIEPRAKTLFFQIEEELKTSSYLSQLGSGLVITGGGSQLNGLVEAGSFFFNLPVRKAYPKMEKVRFSEEIEKSIDPSFATGVGLLSYGVAEDEKGKIFISERALSHKKQHKWNWLFKNVWEKAFPQSSDYRRE